MTDEQVMEAVKNGDLHQVSILFERYNKRIFNFLARMTLDRDTAEDLTQNVFLRIIKYRSSYREGNRFQSWIYQVARNVFSDQYQSGKNKWGQQVDVYHVSDHVPDIDEGMQKDEQEQQLHRSLNRLPDEQRELLILTRFQQMKYEDVALIMDTSVANIKVRVHRAIQKLRQYYFELEND